MKSFKEFLLSEKSEAGSIDSALFDPLPEYFKHYVILMQTIINSKKFDNDRLPVLDSINYCLKNEPKSIFQGIGYRCDYINSKELIEYLSTGKTTKNELGYYSFSEENSSYFKSSNRHTILIQKEIRGIRSDVAAKLLMSHILDYIEEKMFLDESLYDEETLKMSKGLLKELKKEGIEWVSLYKIYYDFILTVKDYFSPHIKKEKESIEKILKPLEPVLELLDKIHYKANHIFMAKPNVHSDELEVLVPGPIFLEKENLLKVRNVLEEFWSSDDSESLKQNFKKIIKIWLNPQDQKDALKRFSNIEITPGTRFIPVQPNFKANIFEIRINKRGFKNTSDDSYTPPEAYSIYFNKDSSGVLQNNDKIL